MFKCHIYEVVSNLYAGLIGDFMSELVYLLAIVIFSLCTWGLLWLCDDLRGDEK